MSMSAQSPRLADLLKMHLDARHRPTRYDATPLQVGMQGDPWRVVLASMLLQQTTRRQAQKGLQALLGDYASPEKLAAGELDEVAWRVRPCGLQRRRAAMLIGFSADLLGRDSLLAECRGVGDYVLDAVGMFCYGEYTMRSADRVLRLYASVNG